MNERNKKENRPSFRKKPQAMTNERPALESTFYDNVDMMRLFKVSARTLQRWRDEKIVPFKKLGGKIYYIPQKVEEMMDDESDD